MRTTLRRRLVVGFGCTLDRRKQSKHRADSFEMDSCAIALDVGLVTLLLINDVGDEKGKRHQTRRRDAGEGGNDGAGAKVGAEREEERRRRRGRDRTEIRGDERDTGNEETTQKLAEMASKVRMRRPHKEETRKEGRREMWMILKTYVSLALHSKRYETRLK